MNQTATDLQELFSRIPRRHSLENVQTINSILSDYENLLITIEAMNTYYEKNMPVFFDDLELTRSAIKKSTDNKASKKLKDNFFAEGSVILKDSMLSLIDLYADGKKIA